MVLFLHLSLGFSKTSINKDAYKNDPPAGAAPPVQAPITPQATDDMDQSKRNEYHWTSWLRLTSYYKENVIPVFLCLFNQVDEIWRGLGNPV